MENYQTSALPVWQLKTSRNFIMVILLSFITLGIYGIYFYCTISNDINTIASRYDGRKTMHFLLVFLLSLITFGIAALVWFHKMSGRIGSELRRRSIDYTFGASTFWLWYVLGSLIIIGPFVYLYKLCLAMNEMSEHYNTKG